MGEGAVANSSGGDMGRWSYYSGENNCHACTDADCSKRCLVVFNSNKWNRAFEDRGPF